MVFEYSSFCSLRINCFRIKSFFCSIATVILWQVSVKLESGSKYYCVYRNFTTKCHEVHSSGLTWRLFSVAKFVLLFLHRRLCRRYDPLKRLQPIGRWVRLGVVEISSQIRSIGFLWDRYLDGTDKPLRCCFYQVYGLTGNSTDLRTHTRSTVLME